MLPSPCNIQVGIFWFVLFPPEQRRKEEASATRILSPGPNVPLVGDSIKKNTHTKQNLVLRQKNTL